MEMNTDDSLRMAGGKEKEKEEDRHIYKPKPVFNIMSRDYARKQNTGPGEPENDNKSIKLPPIHQYQSQRQ